MAPPDHPSPLPSDPRLQQLERLTYLLDRSIRVPGIGYRIGLDGLLGLIPYAGDVAGLGLSSYIVFQAARAGISMPTLFRMVVNLAVDAVIGSIPFLGDLFDFGWKANSKNMALLRAHYNPAAARRTTSNRTFFVLLLAALLIVIGMGVVATVWILGAVLRLIGLEAGGWF